MRKTIIYSISALLLVVCLLQGARAQTESNVIVVNDKTTSINMGLHLEILEDKYGILTIDDVTSPHMSRFFKKSTMKSPSYGFTDSVYWVRFAIDSELTEPTTMLVELTYPLMDDILFFIPNASGSFSVKRTGYRHPFSSRDIEHRNFVFKIMVLPKKNQTFYFRFENEDRIEFPLLLWSNEAFYKNDHFEQYIYGLYYGILFVMLFYNFFIFLFVKDRTYIYYVFYILIFGLVFLTQNGYIIEYIWPKNLFNYTHFVHYLDSLLSLSVLLFSIEYLLLKKTLPLFYKIVNSIKYITLITFPLFIFIPYNIALQIIMPILIIDCFVLLTAGIILLFRRYRPAQIYLIAWTTFLIFGIIYLFKVYAIFPTNTFTNHSVQVGSVILFILFSSGLGTRVRLLEKEKQQTQQALIVSQKAAIEDLHRVDRLKDEFLANTSHELRTPLNGIISLAENMVQAGGKDLSPQTQTNLGLIIASGKRLFNLINDILDYSKLRNNDIVLQQKAVDLHGAVDATVALLFQLTSGKELQIENRVPASVPLVYADENRLQQILYNLVGNAVKFTETGSVTIGAEVKDDNHRNRMIAVSISDTGIGIRPEHIEKIFDSFEQADGSISRVYGGTGIGLSIVKKLVKLHGGDITVRSQPGEGSCFSFSLPLADEGSTALQQAVVVQNQVGAVIPEAGEGVDRDLSRDTVLVVDDDATNRYVISQVLINGGYNVATAESGAAALEMLRDNESSYFDCILLDIMMPRMSGYEVCRIVREKYELYQLPVIMLTAKTREEDIVAGFKAGANDYCTKPINGEELLARIRTLVLLKKTAKKYHDARYRILQEKMKPHFLFNSLNIIHTLVKKDADAADRLVLALAENYRFIMHESYKVTIPFMKEWEFVKNYLAVQAYYFPEQGLAVDYFLNGDFSELKIPPLTLQPLVENCIKHGLRERLENSRITIAAQREGSHVSIKVSDNGTGLCDDEVSYSSLENIKRRLLHVFDDVDVSLCNNDAGGVCAVVQFRVRG